MNSSLQILPVDEVLQFWFGETLSKPEALPQQMRLWFGGGESVDAEVREKFGSLFDNLIVEDWENLPSPEALLAALIVFDQFSRNCFRGSARAFAYDVYALDLLDIALEREWDAELHPLQRAFLYMPLQHIETRAGQRLGVAMFELLAADPPEGYEAVLKSNLEYAHQHHDLIARFGRFPHRNAVLGRSSTPQERAYLEEGGARFGQ